MTKGAVETEAVAKEMVYKEAAVKEAVETAATKAVMAVRMAAGAAGR